MKLIYVFLLAIFISKLSAQELTPNNIKDNIPPPKEMKTILPSIELKNWRKEKEETYQHMKRYGVNQKDFETLRKINNMSPLTFIDAEDLFRPGEYYHFELDDYLLNIIVPEGEPYTQLRIWPYINTRTQNDTLAKYFQLHHKLDIASLSWKNCFFIECNISGISVLYRGFRPSAEKNSLTPEKLLQAQEKFVNSLVLTQAEIDTLKKNNNTNSRMGTQIVVHPEIVVINGRSWVKHAIQYKNEGTPLGQYIGNPSPTYTYITILGQDRLLIVNGDTSDNQHDLSKPNTWSKAVKKGYARIDELVNSIRVTKIHDDGSPDPFVVERVQPAPLPVREPLPDNQ